MQKLSFLSLIATFAYLSLYAQTPDYRYGKVSADELKMTTYEKDPDANAVYLYEGQTIYYQFTSGVLLETDYIARIKILKPEGTDQANVSIRYNDEFTLRDIVSGLDATAYNLEGGKIVKTPLKKEYIFKEQVNENIKLIKFSIPEVREGTVIEYKYHISSKNITYIPSFRLQHSIPVMRSRMTAAVPEFFVFNIATKGYVPINVTRDYSTGTLGAGSNTLTYNVLDIKTDATDIPALKNEAYVWCLDDFRSALDFELSQIALPGAMIKNYTTSWADVNLALEKSTFDSHCRIGNPYKDEVAAIKATQSSPQQKIRAILRLVQSKIKWDEKYRLFSEAPRSAATKGSGSSADINFVLMAALKDAGFKVTPILLRPRHLGRLPLTYPTIDGIYAFVLQVQDDTERYGYVDGTDPNSDLNILPTELLVDRARTYGVNDDSGWCDLTNLGRNTSSVNMILTLNADNTLTGEITEQHSNQTALNVSTAYTEAKSHEEYVEALEKEHEIQIEDLKVEGIGTNQVTQQYRITSQLTGTDEFTYINATVIPFMKTNRLNAQSRTLPIEFSLPTTYNIRCTLILPEGGSLEEAPKNINISVNENSARSRYISNQTGNQLQFSFVFGLNRVIFLPTEFQDINTFYGMVADLSNSQFVIRKNSSQ